MIGYGYLGGLLADINYCFDNNVIHLGGTYQFSGQLGEAKTSQLPNYGRTSLGGDSYFVLFDAGYSRWITNRIALNAEVSIGSQSYFTNYSDKRFKAGGYHLITESAFVAGIGGKLIYGFPNGIGFFAGYNALSGITGGLCFMPSGLKSKNAKRSDIRVEKALYTTSTAKNESKGSTPEHNIASKKPIDEAREVKFRSLTKGQTIKVEKTSGVWATPSTDSKIVAITKSEVTFEENMTDEYILVISEGKKGYLKKTWVLFDDEKITSNVSQTSIDTAPNYETLNTLVGKEARVIKFSPIQKAPVDNSIIIMHADDSKVFVMASINSTYFLVKSHGKRGYLHKKWIDNQLHNERYPR